MVPRQGGARVLGPTTTRSAQGIATTGRYAEQAGASKIRSPYDRFDPYVSFDSSPGPDPEQERRQTQVRTQAVDEGYVDTPAGEKQGTVDPGIDQAIEDTSIDIAKNVGMTAAIPGVSAIAAGYPAGAVMPAVIGGALAGAPQIAAMNLGLKAVNEGVPELYARARQALNDRSYGGSEMSNYQDAAGNTNYADVDQGLVDDAVQSLSDYRERSQPLTAQVADFASPVTGWLDENIAQPIGERARMALNYMDENVAQPVRGLFGFDEAAPEQAAEGLDDAALGQDAMNPDFANSDYDYNPQVSPAENMEAMMQQERIAQEEREAEEARAAEEARQFQRDFKAAEQLANDRISNRPAGWDNAAFQQSGFTDHHRGLQRDRGNGNSPSQTRASSSPGAVGNRTQSRGGFSNEDSRGYNRSYNGGGGGRGAGSGRGTAGNND